MVVQENLYESLLALESHMNVAMDIVRLCRSAQGKLGSGLHPDCVTKDLTSFCDQLEKMIQRFGEESSKDAKNQQQSLISSAKRFTGQVFVLPMSISLNNGINPKCVKVILEYGLASTSFEGQMFNGKYSRVLLETKATELPKLSLSYKKRYSFGTRAKRPLAAARTVQISYSNKEECFQVTVLFGNHEQDVGQATFLVEWYPNIH